MSKPFAIIKVGDSPHPRLGDADDFEHWIHAGMGAPEVDVHMLDPRRGDALPAPATLAGVIVTGSAAMVSERHDWSERLAAWLADAVRAGTPVLGICYGHQLLAHAMGGEVGFHPDGMELGSVAVTLAPAAADDALFGALPPRFHAHAVHEQTVRRLPDAAVRLAASNVDPVQAFRVGECAWGVQFHPEFTADTMRRYVDRFADKLRRQGCAPEALREGVCDTPDAAGVIGRFVKLAAARPVASTA